MVLKIKTCLLVIVLTVLPAGCNLLSTADCINYLEHNYVYPGSNSIGLSFELQELAPEANNQLLQSLQLHSKAYGSWSNTFSLSAHNQLGAKYNCTLAEQLANTTLNCSLDLSNQTLLQYLGEYNWNVTSSGGMAIGWDSQGANFVDPAYMDGIFVPFYRALYSYAFQSIALQTGDQADTWNASGIRPGYDYLQPQLDCIDMNQYLYVWYTSPGLTEAANSSWFDQMSGIDWQCGYFTLRGVVFPNPADLTIANLLSQNYTTQYLQRRFTVTGKNYISDIAWNWVVFSDIRLIDNYAGVDGITNSFAAAIWAVEIAMEWSLIEGTRLQYYCPIAQPSFQSPLGQAPNFSPSALYYALLTNAIVNDYLPYIIRPTVTAGTSPSIRVYYLDYWSHYGVLILNKDMNTSANGYVDVQMNDISGLYCTYISAPNLTSTTGINYGGYEFTSNSSVPSGTFSTVKILADAAGIYTIPLNYSQMAFCRTFTNTRSYSYFPRWSSSHQSSLTYSSLLLLLILLALYP